MYKKGTNTSVIHKHEPLSYGFIVKASESVTDEMLIEHGITTEPIIFRGSEECKDVARHFVDAIIEVSLKIEKLLMTNIPLTMTAEQEKTYQE